MDRSKVKKCQDQQRNVLLNIASHTELTKTDVMGQVNKSFAFVTQRRITSVTLLTSPFKTLNKT